MLLALSLSSGVEKIGAYAGFASVVGLGVLSLLYFAQAREVKRLREWAGRAPERAVELEEQAVARASGVTAPPAPNPTPAVAPALAAGTGSGSVRKIPSSPVRPAAVPAGQAGGPGAAAAAAARAPVARPVAAPAMMGGPALASATRYAPRVPAAPAPVSAPPPVAAPGPSATSAPPAPGPVATPAPAPAAPAPEADGPSTLEPAVPAALTAAAGGRAAARPIRTAGGAGNGTGTSPTARSGALPPMPPPQAARVTGEPPARQRGRGLLVAGLVVALIAIAGGAFAVIQLVGGGGDSKGAPSSAARAAGKTGKRAKPGASFSRNGVTITVLNGTPVAGLAKRVGAQLVAQGFKQGQVTNASDQARSATIVSYLPGHRADATAVSKALKGADVEPIDPTTKAIACPGATCASTVVVTVGSDRAQ